MNLKEQFSLELKKAMKENDAERKSVIRSILSAIKNSEIDKGSELEESEINAILQKELKVRNEAIEGAEKSNRNDLVQENLREIEIISNFLPKQLTTEELKHLVIETIKEENASGIADMGKVMKQLLPKIAGRASGNSASQLVKEILQS